MNIMNYTNQSANNSVFAEFFAQFKKYGFL